MFENLDLPKLRGMTADQLKTACKNWIDERTRKQLIILIMALKILDIDSFQETVLAESVDSSHGQVRKVYVTKDALGNIIRKEKHEWTYYPPQKDGKCPVNLYTKTELDANDNMIKVLQKTKHYPDERQPEKII